MTSNRAQGRPPKGEAEVGRDRLIAIAQQLMSGGNGKLIGRADLAVAAKVTPALVNYYFRDQASLIEAVTAPVIGRSIAELKQILRGSWSPDAQLKSLIRLFLSFNRDYATYLEGFLSACADDKPKEMYRAILVEAFDDLVAFFAGGVQDNRWQPSNPSFHVFALWGMCKFIAQNPLLPVNMLDHSLSRDEALEAQVELIYDLTAHGLVGRHRRQLETL